MKPKITTKYTEQMARIGKDDPEFDLVTFASGEAELAVTRDWWTVSGRPEEILVSVEVSK